MKNYMKLMPLALIVVGYVAKKMIKRSIASEGITVTLDILK